MAQVDHIIPLWAGGVDTEANKQLLTTKQHIQKTAVGAIARELYYAGDLNINAARGLTIDWRDRDVSDINLKDGKISSNPEEALEIARQKISEWKKPKKVTVSLGDWWEDIRENKLGLDDEWQSLKKSTVGQYTQGYLDKLLFDWPEFEKPTYDSKLKEKNAEIARTIGGIAGGISNFILLGKGLGLIGSALNKARLPWLSKAIVNKKEINNMALMAQKLKLNRLYRAFGGTPIPKGIATAAKTYKKEATVLNNILKKYAPRAGLLAKRIEGGEKLARTAEFVTGSAPTVIAGNTLKSSAIKISPEILQKVASTAPVFGIQNALTKQEERTFGSTISSFLSGAIDGTLFSAASPTIKGSLKLWAAAYAFGVAQEATEENPDYSDAAMNATIMVGLNAIKRIGYTKRMKIAAREAGNEVLRKRGFNEYKVTDKKGNLAKISKKVIENNFLNSYGKLEKALANKTISEEDFKKYAKELIVVTNFVHKELLPETKSLWKDMQDVRSIIFSASNIILLTSCMSFQRLFVSGSNSL